MIQVWYYTLASVIAVSAISLVGIFTLGMKQERLERAIFYLISFSVGALLGDVFIHILPEIMGEGDALRNSAYVLAGIMLFFVLERVLMWHGSHSSHREEIHSVVYLTIVGDALHNFLDGVVIAASFLAGIPIGIATATAVIFHEIPQEIGQFAILVHGGWSRRKALLYNFFSALTAIAGALLVLVFSRSFTEAPAVLLGLGAASFIYIAMSDLIPELQKEPQARRSIVQLACMLAGIGVMALLLLLE
ncbi:ZIP family metal transporter [Candidatus Kaiserbacteria bacterium]|nr:ZIP family metal transporter [Candidatus Kaiserbacteria bacterium]